MKKRPAFDALIYEVILQNRCGLDVIRQSVIELKQIKEKFALLDSNIRFYEKQIASWEKILREAAENGVVNVSEKDLARMSRDLVFKKQYLQKLYAMRKKREDILSAQQGMGK